MRYLPYGRKVNTMKLFDFHCDTVYEMHKRGLSFDNDKLHIAKEKTRSFKKYVQVFALWTDNTLSDDEAYRNFFDMLPYYESISEPNIKKILGVEGSALLGDDINRLNVLYEKGVRVLTLVWRDTCKIGGAYNTDVGLTDFGRKVVLRCFELGIVPDLSHASRKMIKEVLALAKKAGKPVIASHSNSYSMCAHDRNLLDEDFTEICKTGGIVGISLAPQHLCINEKECEISDVIRHIKHYLSLGYGDKVCFGCDFDGVSNLPRNINGVEDLYKIFDALTQNKFTEEQICGFFFDNAANFAERNNL